ncbi:MAG: LacI family transcriptional regulator [Ruminococcaceae bacterium]|nr:LacI family transcriptional regulator [Oscillospiraceae bacterium]
MVSMKDIARRCGVSVATVSKALNNAPDVGAETRDRICRTAEELGYMANAAARALKTNRTYNIGVLFVDRRHSGLAHEFFSTVLDSLRVEAEKSGYDITFINSNLGDTSCTYMQHCRYRGVDGVVIASADFHDPMVVELVDSELPVVTIDHVFNNRIAVVSDNAKGAEALVRFAAEKGHKRLAFIHGELTAVTEHRLIGFYRACGQLGLDVPEAYVRESAYHDAEQCYRICKELLALEPRPDCILFPDDYSYIGGMNAIREAGLRIPEDVSVMGYDGINLSRVISPKLTTYRQDTGEMGRVAAAELIGLIEHPKTALLDRIVIPGSLQEGESVSTL